MTHPFAAMRALSTVLVLVATSAAAQYSNIITGREFGSMWAAGVDMTMSQAIQRSMVESNMRTYYGKAVPNASPPKRANVRVPHTAMSATDFLGGQRMLPERFGAMAGGDPRSQRQMTILCGAILDGFERQREFRRNNVAVAVSLLVAGALQVLTEQTIPPAQSQELVRVMNDMFAANDGFRRMQARQKQALYEMSLITSGLILTTYEQAKQTGNLAVKRQAQGFARQVLGQLVGTQRSP